MPAVTPPFQGLLFGSGVPTAFAPAGTLYSRTDAAHIYSSQPAPANQPITIVQSCINRATSQLTFASALTPGNLIVAFCQKTDNNGLPALNGWTQAGYAKNGSLSSITLYTRTVQAGDGTTPPIMIQNILGNGDYVTAFELSSTAPISVDSVVGNGVASGSGATSVMAGITPTFNNQLILGALQQTDPSDSLPCTIGAPYTQDKQNSAFFGHAYIGHTTTDTAATPLGPTASWSASGYSSACYMQVSIKATLLAANWVLLV